MGRLAFATVLVSTLVLLGGVMAGLVSASDQVLSAATVDAAVMQTPASDRAALVALYNATGGPNWRDNTNWLSDEPLEKWHGVTVDSDGRVASLDLSKSGLNGSIPNQLGNLTNLNWLDLNQNQLIGAIPDALPNIPNLQSLNLSWNALNGTIPGELGNLSNLQDLNLSANQFTGEIPGELGKLANLKSLSLSSNQLTGEIPSELGGACQPGRAEPFLNQ